MERREFLKLLSAGGVLAFAVPACDLFPSSKNAAVLKDLPKLDMISQAALVQRKELTALELVEAAIGRIEKYDGKINAVVTQSFDMARARAKGAVANGKLWGAPYLIKDLTPYKGVRWTSGSRFYKNRIADSQTPFVDSIENSGMIVLGKTNTPEFGLTSTTEPLALDPCRNPWNLDYSTGGSSGGATAAVAARLVPAAQSSDGGGSIRLPASNCGMFGLKPTRGRLGNQIHNATKPPWEITISHTTSWSVRDSAFIFALTERPPKNLKPVGFVNRPINRKLKIAMSLTDGEGRDPHPEVKKAVLMAAKLLESLGHTIVPTERTPLQDPTLVDSFITYWASGAAAVREGIMKEGGKNAEELLEPWTLGLAQEFNNIKDKSAEMKKILNNFKKLQRNARRFLTRYDAWLSPVTATPPPKIGYQSMGEQNDYATVRERVLRFAAYCPLHNVAGTPSMSVPMYWTADDLPVGVQIAANYGRDGLLFALAYQMEAAKPWANKMPALIR